MSNTEENSFLTIKYNGIEKKIQNINNYEELKNSFIQEFNENENKNFQFSYQDNEDDLIEIDEKSSENIIKDAKEFIIDVALKEKEEDEELDIKNLDSNNNIKESVFSIMSDDKENNNDNNDNNNNNNLGEDKIFLNELKEVQERTSKNDENFNKDDINNSNNLDDQKK